MVLGVEAIPDSVAFGVPKANYVGLEFAQMFRRFGSAVTVVEQNPSLLAHEDADACEAVREALAAEGIVFRFNAECIRL